MTAQYFAQLNESNVVVDVAVVSAEFMAENPDRYPGRWVETFFDSSDKKYAGVGMIYDEDAEDFSAPVIEEPSA